VWKVETVRTVSTCLYFTRSIFFFTALPFRLFWY